MREPYQGVRNIIRFNWHFYVLAVILIVVAEVISYMLPDEYAICIHILCGLTVLQTAASLCVSLYIYDLSGLYQLSWLDDMNIPSNGAYVNIHAGFDETSELLKNKYPDAELTVFDFYDPAKHTEISIQRARKAYPSYPGTIRTGTSSLAISNASIDVVFATLAAHEIRNDDERIIFFKELKRILKPSGQIIITEHLRDLPNLLAYNIGFLHFLGRKAWEKTILKAGLQISHKKGFTPFITTFSLRHDGTAS